MVEIKDNYFKAPDGNRYFRRNAPAVEVGAHGEKKEPVPQANYLAVEGHIRYEFLDGKVKKLKPVEVDWSREKKADVEANVEKYFDLGGVTLDFSHEKAANAHLKLVRFHVDAGAMESVLNTDANKVREDMKKEGKDARLCTSTWVVMSGQLAERFDTSLGLEVSGTTADALSITAKGGGTWSGAEKVTFSPGTVFAYGLHKVKKWNGDKVEDLEDDWQSIG
jgi:hypothetical protein